jgi:hypothetical protein
LSIFIYQFFIFLNIEILFFNKKIKINKMENESQIEGNGYGSSHVWIRLQTRELPHYASKSLKNTIYRCKICGTPFIHYYGTFQNIFDALERSGVPDKCEKIFYNEWKEVFQSF